MGANAISMIDKIINYSLENKFIVLLIALLCVAGGIYSAFNIKLDAIPDLSDVQVIVYTEYQGQSPQVVEDQVTYPLTTAMLSVPFAKVVRGYSFFGFSLVYIIFDDGTDIYWARSRILEYLNFVAGRLPEGVNPTLGPDATGVGWIFEYTVEDKSGKLDLAELRSIQDWFLRYELMTVPGVAEVASLGGFVKQYQVEVDPDKLLAYNIPLAKIKEAVKRSNNDVGGRLIEQAETEFMVRGLGYISSLEDLKNVPIGIKNGTPIFLRSVARIHFGPELRRGLAEKNGEGEVVAGIVIMRFGENALQVINDVKKKLEELKTGLPPGVEIITAYDRSSLIKRAIATLTKKLMEEIGMVALICIIFLLHARSVFVAVIALPISVLTSIWIMYILDINANIMSLGGIAIAIGVMVDASIVMVENAHRGIERNMREGGKKSHSAIIAESTKEVGPALFFSLIIIAVSFFPVFALKEQSGRLFKPLAYTKTFAMVSAAFISITLIPVLISIFIRGKIPDARKNPLTRFLEHVYHPIIRFVLQHRKTTLLAAALLLLATYLPLNRLGSEFMPPLNEGDILYMPTTDPGISITKAKELLQQTNKIIASFPEVDLVFGKVGRANTATDPAPLSMIETIITLKPESQWRDGMTHEKLIEELDKALRFPGLTNAWTMPIKTRIDMLSTGIKTPVGIKIAGEDLNMLSELGDKIASVLRKVPGTLSVYAEKTVGGNYVDFKINRIEAARYGLTVGDIQDVIISAMGGMNVTYTVEGRERYPVNIRYSRELRDNITALKRVLIPTPTGSQIPITQVAEISITKGPPAIKTENAKLNAWLYIDLTGIDIGTYVKNAKKAVSESISLPAGYSIIWSGQYEYMERSAKTMRVVIPITLFIVFLLLYFHFKNLTDCLIVMFSLPFALIGGIWLLYLLDYNLSVAVYVGFISLAGLAAETGVIMLIYLKLTIKRYKLDGKLNSVEDLNNAITEGVVTRLRPILMTVSTTIFGLIPIMWSSETGSQVMKRLAAPMIGGLISATVLTLVIIPVIYLMVERVKMSNSTSVSKVKF